MSNDASPTLAEPFFEQPPTAFPMMSAYLPMVKSAAMTSAAELGVFHHLHRQPASPLDAAQQLGASAQGMQSLFHALASFGLLHRNDDGTYRNAAFIERYFTPAAAADLTPGLLWNAEAMKLMTGLTDAIRHGQPSESMWTTMARRPGMGALFSRYMEAFAGYFSDDLLQHIDIPADARQLLDIGGSHGLHAASLCLRHPQLHATVFDLAESLTQTPRVIEQHGLQSRMTLRAGDAVADDFGSGSDGGKFDVVLLLSVLHNQTETDAQDIVRRALDALKPGGLIVIHEYFHDPVNPGRYAASFLLTLLVEVGTTLQHPELLQTWLRDGGCRTIRRVDMAEEGKGSLLLATRDGGGQDWF